MQGEKPRRTRMTRENEGNVGCQHLAGCRPNPTMAVMVSLPAPLPAIVSRTAVKPALEPSNVCFAKHYKFRPT